MRKVSKLVLASLALASFVCLLFYKSRYDKLYNVLEVLEFFGNAPNSVRSVPIFHPPSWQRLTDKVFAYSAHCGRQPGSDDICPVVTLVALANLSPLERPNGLQELTCQLWYDSSIQPIAVPITTSEAAVNSNADENPWKAFIFNCESKFAKVLPFGVSLGTSSASSSLDFKGYLHVEAPLTSTISSKDVLACIAPQLNRVDSTFQALENVLLNSYFGIKHFHIYDNGLTNRFVQTLSDFARSNHINVAVLPWNVPGILDEKTTQYLVEIDCHMRAKAQGFATNLVLSGNQVLVPKSGAKTVQSALQMSAKKGQLLVDVLKFCSEYPEENSGFREKQITALSQSIFNNQLSSGLAVKVSHQSGSQQFRISRDELAVHDYGLCNNYDLDVKGPESVRDRSVSRHAVEIERLFGQYFPPITA